MRGRTPVDLGPVEVGGVVLRNPVMTASGTAGHDVELAHRMDLASLGAVVVKSLHVQPWPGNPAPRVHTAGNGMLNAVGLEGPGVTSWCEHSLPRLERTGATVVRSEEHTSTPVTRSSRMPSSA